MEKMIVHALVRDLNSNFDVGLCNDLIIVPETDQNGPDPRKPKFLFIGGSHALREAQCMANKGYEVITCAVSGWRANKTASEEMAEQVQEALRGLCEDDIIVVHCCDNTAFMARTEEGGDLPIRNISGEYHVEGDLVVASKERLFMFFKNCLPSSHCLRAGWLSSSHPCHVTCTPAAASARSMRRTGPSQVSRSTSGRH
jgi:hypothetical protein